MRFVRVALGLVLLSISAAAQQYVISTFAGGAPPPTPVRGVDLATTPYGVATDAVGNVYFTSDNCVFRLDQTGIVTRVAGNSRRGYSGDGGFATSAQLNYPIGVAVDGAGNLFFADALNFRIRKVSQSGIITTVAGSGTQGYSGDDGPATSAQLGYPQGVALDVGGNLFIADSGNGRVRKVSLSGIIITVAGNNAPGTSGDGGPATNAQVSPAGVVVDRAGNLFIADAFNSRVRMVSSRGIITTVAGNGTRGISGDGGPATSAQLYAPQSVALDEADNLFIADSGNGLLRKVSPSGIITTAAGGGKNVPGDGGPAISAQFDASGVAVDRAGNLFLSDLGYQSIRKISPDGIITKVAGNGRSTLYGTFSGDGGPAVSVQLGYPTGVAVDAAGNLFIAESGRIRKVSTTGIITTVAGDGTYGFSGDGGPATSAQLAGPFGPFSIAVDDADNLFFADSVENDGFVSDQRVRKVSADGMITTVAGNGTRGFSGDGGPATDAQLNVPTGLAVDHAGTLFIADIYNIRIRAVSKDGTITTVAGNGTLGSSGDGEPAVSAQLFSPIGVAVDRTGDLFIEDSLNRLRKISSSGIITTVAGNGVSGFSGDGGPATKAQLNNPEGVAVDGAGNLFIADVYNSRIRLVSTDGTITTAAGNGTRGFSGDGGPAASAALSFPEGVAVDRAGNVYIADGENHAVRVLRPTNLPVLIGAVVDAASQGANPVSPGKIVVIYGAGLGPAQLVQNQPSNDRFGTEVGGTTIFFNAIAAPVLYASNTQVAAVVPYALSGTMAQITVTYQGQTSAAFAVPVAPSAPSLFTLNQTGAGQVAAINSDGMVNTAANPVKIGDFVSLYATGEGQTAQGGVDGKIGGSTPILPVKVTIGGTPATVQYAGGAPGQVAGLMQVNVQIPDGVQPGGYVPVVLQVGEVSTTPGAVWIAVAGN